MKEQVLADLHYAIRQLESLRHVAHDASTSKLLAISRVANSTTLLVSSVRDLPSDWGMTLEIRGEWGPNSPESGGESDSVVSVG